MHVIKHNSLIRIPACMQVGLAEMKPVVDMTGGMVVQTDTFHNPVFKESLKRVFVPPGTQGSLEVASNATFEVSKPLCWPQLSFAWLYICCVLARAAAICECFAEECTWLFSELLAPASSREVCWLQLCHDQAWDDFF